MKLRVYPCKYVKAGESHLLVSYEDYQYWDETGEYEVGKTRREKRPDWDTYFLNIAETVAQRSEDPKTQVGCVIVKDNRIVSTGYNGAPAGIEIGEEWHTAEKHKKVLHSELNAIIYAGRDKAEGATLYCTHSPCKECVKTIAAAGIKRVVYKMVYCQEALQLLNELI